jgi:hypothetical protein
VLLALKEDECSDMHLMELLFVCFVVRYVLRATVQEHKEHEENTKDTKKVYGSLFFLFLKMLHSYLLQHFVKFFSKLTDQGLFQKLVNRHF